MHAFVLHPSGYFVNPSLAAVRNKIKPKHSFFSDNHFPFTVFNIVVSLNVGRTLFNTHCCTAPISRDCEELTICSNINWCFDSDCRGTSGHTGCTVDKTYHLSIVLGILERCFTDTCYSHIEDPGKQATNRSDNEDHRQAMADHKTVHRSIAGRPGVWVND